MNHIFRVIFDKTRGIFVAVSELTKSHGKAKSEQNIEMGGGGGKTSLSLVPRYSNFFAFNSVYSAFLISCRRSNLI
ncbi:ESPR domain-containing protein [Gallibacterium faecale]|uniref:ESPR domain-containing protein n=1 Tax=Gallibacterium faecale TaxID=3019086 RepID=UPI0039B7447D